MLNKQSESREQFTYIWVNTETDKYYIGSHFGQPDDGYVCGNREVKRSIRRNPDNWKRAVVETDDCRKLEKIFLRSLNAAEDRNSYNKCNYAAGVVKQTEKAKKLISENNCRYWKGKERPDHSKLMKGNTYRSRKCRHIPSGAEYDSLKEAGKAHNRSTAAVSNHCSGRLKKQLFEYVEPEEDSE